MTEAGQIFALLRSASAAELAKRFNSLDQGPAAPLPQPTPAAGLEPARPGQGQSGSGATGGGFAGSGAGTAQGALPGGPGGGPSGMGPTLPTAATPVDVATRLASPPPLGVDAADPLAPSRPAVLRAAFSLANLAPPRADLVRFLADAGANGLQRLPGPVATAGLASTPAPGVAIGLAGATAGQSPTDATRPGSVGAATVDGEASLPAVVNTTTERAGAALAVGPGALGSAPSATGTPGAAGTPDASDLAPQHGLAVSSRAGAAPAASAASGTGAAIIGESADAAAATLPGAQAAAPGAAMNAEAARTVTVAQIAFAEAAIALIDAATTGRNGSVASGVIFNAAMMPGWPFPTAFAKDGPQAINPKAMLNQLATALESMSPQEAADYLARIGGGYLFLRKLRHLLNELDMIGKDDVKGLLFSFLETLSTIATGLQTAFKLLSESAALQAAVAHGEVPEDDGRPGRRRLRL